MLSGDSQEEVYNWFQQALGVRCCLVRQRPGSRKPLTPIQLGKPANPVQMSKPTDQDPIGHLGKGLTGLALLILGCSILKLPDPPAPPQPFWIMLAVLSEQIWAAFRPVDSNDKDQWHTFPCYFWSVRVPFMHAFCLLYANA